MREDEKIRNLAARIKWLGWLAVVGSLAVGGMLWRNANRLHSLDSEIRKNKDTLEKRKIRLAELNTTVRFLKYGKSEGVRATATRVPKVDAELYDVNVWIDAGRFEKQIREVHYQFQNRHSASSAIAEIGFGTYFRDLLKCPEKAAAIITFADATERRIDFDLCQIAGQTLAAHAAGNGLTLRRQPALDIMVISVPIKQCYLRRLRA